MKQLQPNQEHNEGDFIVIMNKENFPQGKIDEVMTTWKMSGKANAIKVLDKYLRLMEFQKAEAAVYKARNHHFLSQLYLSDEVEKMSLEFLNKLHSVFIDYEMIYEMQGISSFGDISKISDSAAIIKIEVDSILDNITKQMQSELSIGYYKQKAT
jgi:hypothetical protein